MARKKEVSIESVFEDFSALDLQDQVSVFKLLQGKLLDTAAQIKQDISEKENSVDLLSTVLSDKA